MNMKNSLLNIVGVNKYRLLNILLLLFIFLGCIARIIQSFTSRTLWLDEAMTINSVLTRNLEQLWASPLDFSQNAPLGYLYTVKIFSILFGKVEWALRLPSLIASLGTIILSYLILKITFKTKFPLIGAAIISEISIFIRYSAEVKPYATDVFLVLSVLLIYGFFKNGRINFFHISTFFSILIWFSFQSIFVITSIMFWEFILFIKRLLKDKVSFNNIFQFIAGNITVLLSLILCYILWLNPGSNNLSEYDAYDYWRFLSFPVIPKTTQDLQLIIKMITEIFLPLNVLAIDFILLAIIGIYFAIKEKNHVVFTILLSLPFMLIVSSIGKYPIISRLTHFVPTTFVLVAIFALDRLYNILENCNLKLRKLYCSLIIIIIIDVIAVNFINIIPHFNSFYYPRYGSVENKQLEFIRSSLKSSDKLYIFYYNYPCYLYKTNYKNYQPKFFKAPYEKDEIIFGSFFAKSAINKPYKYNWAIDYKKMNIDISAINKYNSVYILIINNEVPEAPVINAFINKLNSIGHLKLVNTENSTNLYYFTK